MVLAVDKMHGHGSSNEMHPQLQLKKTKVCKAVLAVNIATIGILCAVRTFLTRWRMVLPVDMMLGHGPSNKMHPQLQPKKTIEVRLY